MEDHWAKESAIYCGVRDLFKGTSENTFSPDVQLSRAMMITILHRIEKENATETAGFADVLGGAYYEDAVAWGVEKEIVKGVSETDFAPDQAITREQMAAMLYRYAHNCGYVLSGDRVVSFDDAGEIQSYAKDAMEWAVAKGLFSGKGNNLIDPRGYTTRAEAVSIFERFIKNVLNVL